MRGLWSATAGAQLSSQLLAPNCPTPPPRSQWFVLNRQHAELAAADTAVDAALRRDCLTSPMSQWGKPGSWFCASDEHYIPTLLAVHGLDNE